MRRSFAFVGAVIVAATFALPITAAHATLDNGKPYCVADLSQPAQGYSQADFSPALTCYGAITGYRDRLDAIDANGGWVLMSAFTSSNFSGPRVGFFAPASYGACGRHHFYVDHMPATYDDAIYSVIVWARGGATCNIGYMHPGASQTGGSFNDGALGGGVASYSDCYSDWSNLTGINGHLSSFELTQVPLDTNGCQ